MTRLYLASRTAWNALGQGDDRLARQEIAEQQARQQPQSESEPEPKAPLAPITNPRVQLAVGAWIVLGSDQWAVVAHDQNVYGTWVTTLCNERGFQTRRPLAELVRSARVAPEREPESA